MAETGLRILPRLLRPSKSELVRHCRTLQCSQRHLSTITTTSPPPAPAPNVHQWQPHQSSGFLHPEEPQRKRLRLQKLRDETDRPFSSFLTDTFNRQHTYLRISVTERCNLRCTYCMPESGIDLSPPDHLLTTSEIIYLAGLFVNQGVNKIRLTGGEPTVRKDILELMHEIGKLRQSGLKELCLTTNGISLHRKLDAMVQSGLTAVNLSLDTLDPYQFAIITRRNGHEAVMKSIRRILEMNKMGAGIKLKINCVVMRGINEREILPFVELGREQDLEVRFIEYMPFDGNKWSEKKMLSFGEMLALIRQTYPDVHRVQDHPNDTSKTYKVPGFAGRIGFITSMTENFCGTCNRLRITSDGNLKVCLFGNAEVSLRDILRESNEGKPIDAQAMEAIKQLESDRRQQLAGSTGALGVSEKEAKLLDVIGMAVKRKEEKHAGIGDLENMKNRPMILIDDAFAAKRPYSFSSSATLFSQISSPVSSSCQPRIPTHLLHPSALLSSSLQARCYSSFRRSVLARSRAPRHSSVVGSLDTPKPPAPGLELPTDPSASEEPWWEYSDTARSQDALETRTEPQSNPTTSPRAVVSLNNNMTLNHLTDSGEAHMVSIRNKQPTFRSARATTLLLFSHGRTYHALHDSQLQKGDALAVARVAGIQAAKKTADLIPLAHPGLSITGVKVDLEPFAGEKVPHPLSLAFPDGPYDTHEVRKLVGGVLIMASVACEGKTGVEMEAMTAASVAGLTMYDMLKGVDKGMVLTSTRVISKVGGKSGDWRWDFASQERVFPKPPQQNTAVTSEHVNMTDRTPESPRTPVVKARLRVASPMIRRPYARMQDAKPRVRIANSRFRSSNSSVGAIRFPLSTGIR